MERDDRRPLGLIKDVRRARRQLVKKFYKFKMKGGGISLVTVNSIILMPLLRSVTGLILIVPLNSVFGRRVY